MPGSSNTGICVVVGVGVGVQPGTIGVGLVVGVFVSVGVSSGVMAKQPEISVKNSNRKIDIEDITLVFILFIIINHSW